MFFDVFLTEPDPGEDKVFIDAIKKNNRTVIDFVGENNSTESDKAEMDRRIALIKNKFGVLENVSGSLQDAVIYFGLTPPLPEYIDAVSMAGAANLGPDNDNILRKFPLVYKYIDQNRIFLNDIKPGDDYDFLFLKGYNIAYNKNNNEYTLSSKEELIFDQSEKPVKNRIKLDAKEINGLNVKIQSIENNFYNELNKLKEKSEKENYRIYIDIRNYFIQKKLDNEIKLPENLQKSKIEPGLSALLNYLKNDPSKADACNFVNEKYKQLIKIDREGESSVAKDKTTKKTSLYDFIYVEKPEFKKFICREGNLSSVDTSCNSSKIFQRRYFCGRNKLR